MEMIRHSMWKLKPNLNSNLKTWKIIVIIIKTKYVENYIDIIIL